MIKRRFFKVEHGDRDDASSDPSSSSDSEVEAEAAEASGDDVVSDPEDNSESDDEVYEEPVENNEAGASSSSGYESEESSANVIDGNLSDEDEGTGNGRGSAEMLKKQSKVMADKESVPDDMPDCVLRCKSVYKCIICPRIVCLTEETIRTHLNSKRHARSEKLLKENRLKLMLNSDGKIENQETPAEVHARITALVQEDKPKKVLDKPKKRNRGKTSGRQRQRMRSKGKEGRNASNIKNAEGSSRIPAKKRHRNES